MLIFTLQICNSNTELVLIHEVAVGGGADQLDVLWDDNEVGDEGHHEGLLKKVFQAACRLRVHV